MYVSLSPFAPENLVSRDRFGSPVPRQPAHLHTQAESGVYLRDSFRFPGWRPYIYLNRHTPLGQSRVCRVTQLRNDGVYCRESAGTGPLNLKVVPVTGVALAGHHAPNNMRFAFPYKFITASRNMKVKHFTQQQGRIICPYTTAVGVLYQEQGIRDCVEGHGDELHFCRL